MANMWQDIISNSTMNARALVSSLNGIFSGIGTQATTGSAFQVNANGTTSPAASTPMSTNTQNPLADMLHKLDSPMWAVDAAKQNDKIINRLDLLVELTARKGGTLTNKKSATLLGQIESNVDETS